MNDIQCVLWAAQMLISEKHDRCIEAMARDSLGNAVNPSSESAIRWCAIGAIRATGASVPLQVEANVLLDNAARKMRCPDSWTVNDWKTHDHVMRMFDLAIELAGE